MKILSVEFENLNSLVGRTKIDFTSPAFSGSGIFAIVGPTGSGKTTILDAICLALYGRTPRLSRISKTQNEIMSRFAGGCFAEVVFETSRHGKFICRWEQRRARNSSSGRLQDPEHEISDAETGEGLAKEQKKEVAKLVEEKTGMNFDRFTRAMMLAQGDFAKFLRSSASERAGILEQITGTEIYRFISKKVYERFQEEKKEFENVEARLEEIRTSGFGNVDDLRSELLSRKRDEERSLNRLEAVREKWNRFEKVRSLRTDRDRLQREWGEWEESELAFRDDAKKWDAAKKTEKIETFYTELQLHRTRSENAKKELADLETELPLSIADAERCREKTNLAESALETSRLEQREGQKIIQTVRQCDTNIEMLDDSLAGIKTRQLEEAERIRQNESEIADFEKNWTSILGDESFAAMEEKLSEQNNAVLFLLDGKKRPELNESADSLSRRIRNMNRLDEFMKNTRLIEEESRKVREEIEDSRQKTRDATKIREGLKEKIAVSEVLVRKLEENRELRKRIAELDDERRRLEDGKPCPLCGALEHPYAAGNIPRPEEVDTELLEARNRLRDLEKESKKQDLFIAAQDEKVRQLEAQFEKNRRQLESRELEVGKISTDAGFVEIPSAERLSETVSECSERADRLRKTLAEIDALQESVEELRERIRKGKEIETEIRTRVSSNEVVRKNLERLDAEFGEKSSRRQTLFEERSRIFDDRNPDRAEKEFEQKVAQAEKTRDEARTEWNRKNEKLERLRQRIETTGQTLRDSDRAVETAEKDFLSRCRGAGFVSETEFLSARLSPEARERLESSERELDSRRRELRALIQQNLDAIEKEREPVEMKYFPAPEALKKVEATRQERYGIVKEEIGKLQQKIESGDKLDSERKRLESKKEKRSKEFELWKVMDKLIGSAEGDKFKNFAQGLTFRIMIEHANRQLKKMSPRYRLIQDEAAKNFLELNVVDLHLAGTVRSTQNLSGGETFLISLALALGLSAMASRNVRVDSLFLDEGFGTLDDQTLDKALAVLEGLRQEGRQIGIISHVKEIRERIPVQIHVRPKHEGLSVVSLSDESDF